MRTSQSSNVLSWRPVSLVPVAVVVLALMTVIGATTSAGQVSRIPNSAVSQDEMAAEQPSVISELAGSSWIWRWLAQRLVRIDPVEPVVVPPSVITGPGTTETPPPPSTTTSLVPQTMTTVQETTTSTSSTSSSTTSSTSTTVIQPVGPWRLTVGSGGATPMDTNSPPGAGSSHGVRIYCVVSHYSHDDSVVFPGQPGAAHAHMFWGNTAADAYSDGASLLGAGNSSCEGGITNRSAYWAPAVFNQNGEALVPEALFVYYKSFFGGPNTDRSTIRPIPNGLQMLANRQVNGANDRYFDVNVGDHLSRGDLQLKVSFPQCLAVDANGGPILTSDDNTSHLSYANDYNSSSNCPASHPYRIPQLTYVMNYDVQPGSSWMLSSDTEAAAPGATLHADYIAAWNGAAMAAIVECNIVERRNCSPEGGRRQLPERFYAPDGTRVYDSSVRLEDDADRTPFGTEIAPHLHVGGHGGR